MANKHLANMHGYESCSVELCVEAGTNTNFYSELIIKVYYK